MRPIFDWVRCNRARSAGIATVIIGWLGVIDSMQFVVPGLLTIVSLLTGTVAVHNAVTNNATVVAAVKDAATSAAIKTAETLTDQSVGETGVITEAGEAVVDLAAIDATQEVLKLAGFSREERAGA